MHFSLESAIATTVDGQRQELSHGNVTRMEWYRLNHTESLAATYFQISDSQASAGPWARICNVKMVPSSCNHNKPLMRSSQKSNNDMAHQLQVKGMPAPY